VIPLLAAFRVGRRRFWIPVPLFVIWLLLLPVCLLLLPVFVVACRWNRVPAGGALVAIWAVLNGLRGTRLLFTHPDATFAVRLI
jgi:hypothetical protein